MDEFSPSRRKMLQSVAALPVAAGLATASTALAASTTTARTHMQNSDVDALDATALAAAIRKGDLSAPEAVEAAIRRAETVEPRIRAIVTETFERARSEARAPLSGPLAGVPTFVKDLDDVKGVPTHSGSRAFGQTPAISQGPYVDALEKSGLLFLGKSATPEFGLTGSTEPLRGPPCRNPWNTEFSPGGSSGGAGALVAARVVPIAHATDGGGSIRAPASCCGVFGLKPSRDRTVPLGRPAGPIVISISHALSISVRDSALWLSVAERTGSDKVFEPTGLVEGPAKRRLRIGLDMMPLRGNPLDDEVRAAIEDTARKCEALGHRVEPAAIPLDKRAFVDAFIVYWASGAAMIVDGLAQQLGRAPTEQDLEPWTLGLASRFQQRRADFDGAVATLRASVATCEAFFEKYDVLLTPTATRPPFPIGYLAPDLPFETHWARALDYVGFTPVQNASGQPAMSVPLHWSEAGLPIGSHFAARAGAERTLLELAYELETAYPWAGRKPAVCAVA
jgi:amidase